MPPNRSAYVAGGHETDENIPTPATFALQPDKRLTSSSNTVLDLPWP